jgi:hypothetical protein
MRLLLGFAVLAVVLPSVGFCQQTNHPEPDASALTIYKDFAVVRSTVDLDLKAGVTDVTTIKVTRQLEPDSVVLRDLNGGKAVNVLEQNYDAAVVDQNTLLRQYEGQIIDFQNLIYRSDQVGQQIVLTQGKVVRAPGSNTLVNGAYYSAPPIIEVDGKLQFQLPGTPLFPTKADSLLLKPTLRWSIGSESASHFTAELDYITQGFSWQATYNIVSPEQTEDTRPEMANLVGWVTIENKSGMEFPEANIKLMAGDVAKIEPERGRGGVAAGAFMTSRNVSVSAEVTQKAFDDFHLYDLHRTVNLRDGETKQVEFLHAANVPVTRKYVYDGAGRGNWDGLYLDQNFGREASKKVAIVQEFKNSEGNHLGIPLPAGRIRFYRQDTGGQVEFTGESTIDHTPKDNTVRVVTGNAFDITGDRKQTDFHSDTTSRTVDESFEIKVKNAKDKPVKITVVEHLYRWSNWNITAKSSDYAKTDSRTIEFPMQLATNEEKTLTYTVHYSW